MCEDSNDSVARQPDLSNLQVTRALREAGLVAGWRDELPARKVAAIEYVCRERMDEFGYAREAGDASAPPALVRKRDARRKRFEAAERLGKENRGALTNAARAVFRRFPALRRLAWKLAGR